MAIPAVEQTEVIDLVQIERGRMSAREPPKGVPQHLPAVGVVDHRGDRQIGLGDRHRGRQHQALPRFAWHQRGWQQIAFAEHGLELWKLRVGSQISPFDIDVRHSSATPLEDLVPWAHDVLAGPELDLLRPHDIGQQLRNLDSARGERRDRIAEGHNALLTHRNETDGAWRDRHRVAVLDPSQYPLAGSGWRETGVWVGSTSVVVMRAGKRSEPLSVGRAVPVEKIERIFDDVVPGRADN